MTAPPVSRRGWVAVLSWLAALAVGTLVIVHTRFSADLSAFLPAAPDARQRALVEQLKSGIAARTLLIAIRGGDAAQRALASRALAERLRANAAFEQVLNGDFTAFAAIGRWVFEHRYLLSPAVDARASAPRACAKRSTTRCRCWARQPARWSSRCSIATPPARRSASPRAR